MFLKILQNWQEKTCARVYFFNKVTGLRPATLLEKRLRHRCFPVNFVKFLRTDFFKVTDSQKYESLYMIAAFHSYSENIWKRSRSISASDCNFRSGNMPRWVDFRERLFREDKNKLDKVEKGSKDGRYSNLKDFILFV